MEPRPNEAILGEQGSLFLKEHPAHRHFFPDTEFSLLPPQALFPFWPHVRRDFPDTAGMIPALHLDKAPIKCPGFNSKPPVPHPTGWVAKISYPLIGWVGLDSH